MNFLNFLPQLISALIMVESGGDASKIGDSGLSYGVLQIKDAVVDDVNNAYGTDYIHADALMPDRARMICTLYLLHYAGPRATPEQCARIWNGGPQGDHKHSTLSYWEKVQQHLFNLPGEPQGDQR